MNTPTKPGRIEALDYLRGYFIIVIVIDHVYRWPSLLSFFTGQSLLWANAADGFIIISGLLVGYVRGFKARESPFNPVALKLFKRGLLLYVWSVILSILFASIQWLINFRAAMPHVEAPDGNWAALITNSITLTYAHPWIYFLHLYAIFMLVAIGAVWLLRRHLAWLVILFSIAAIFVGNYYGVEWIQRAPFFFIPVAVGYYLESIQRVIIALRPTRQRILSATAIFLFISTATLSSLWRFSPELFSPALHDFLSQLFNRGPLSIGALVIAFVWFIGLFALFQALLPLLRKYLRWLMLPFGQRSLAAYMIHGIPILITSYFFFMGSNVWHNTALGIICILTTIGLLRIPFVQRLLPR